MVRRHKQTGQWVNDNLCSCFGWLGVITNLINRMFTSPAAIYLHMQQEPKRTLLYYRAPSANAMTLRPRQVCNSLSQHAQLPYNFQTRYLWRVRLLNNYQILSPNRWSGWFPGVGQIQDEETWTIELKKPHDSQTHYIVKMQCQFYNIEIHQCR